LTPTRPEGLQVALRVIDAFERLGVEYHLGGSYASSIHGVPRQTQDVDLVADLRPHHVEPLVAELGAEFYADPVPARRAVEQRSSFNVLHLSSGVKVDVFCRGDSAFDHSEFERAQPTKLFGHDPVMVRVKSAEDTVLRKLHWYRMGGESSDRQWNDVLGCLGAARRDVAYMRRWARQLGVEDLLEVALVAAKK
jgi:hypothetical protein